MDEPAYGIVVEAGPLARRLLAPNPSPFTFTGTQTHIVGRGEVAIIDPGPDSSVHIEAVLGATENEQIIAIVCTHTHRDHSPAANFLKEATGAPIIGCAPLALADEGGDESFDPLYQPDRVLLDGETLSGPGWTLEAVATPGHTSNHLCFALPQEGVLFSGDHVMGWSTSIVSPPDGNMGAYRASLHKLLARPDLRYLPAHGGPIDQPHQYVRRLIAHRQAREDEIIEQLQAGAARISDMVSKIYRELDPMLHPAAARSVLAHLEELAGQGRVTTDGERWKLRA